MYKRFIKILTVLNIVLCFNIESYLKNAESNRFEIIKALNTVPKDQRKGMEWLISNMPKEDLKSLSSDFLLTNTNQAYQSWMESKWYNKIPERIFYDNILPYASLNEKREEWREDFKNLFRPLIKNANSPSEAAAILNNTIYKKLNVIYSTKRPKADQSPGESIDAGMASCTGLSILLIDACRSVGVPARFVGTSSWYNNSGNHSWVEIWDEGWHFTGAAEPVGDSLNVGWFTENASKAIEGDQKYGIFAVTWEKKFSSSYFPMDWLPNVKTYHSIDVTDRYKIKKISNSNLIPISIKILDKKGERISKEIIVSGPNDYNFTGVSKDESCDLNDHLTLMLPVGKDFTFFVDDKIKNIKVLNEFIIEFNID